MVNILLDQYALGDLAEETGNRVEQIPGTFRVGFTTLVGNGKVFFYAIPSLTGPFADIRRESSDIG